MVCGSSGGGGEEEEAVHVVLLQPDSTLLAGLALYQPSADSLSHVVVLPHLRRQGLAR